MRNFQFYHFEKQNIRNSSQTSIRIIATHIYYLISRNNLDLDQQVQLIYLRFPDNCWLLLFDLWESTYQEPTYKRYKTEQLFIISTKRASLSYLAWRKPILCFWYFLFCKFWCCFFLSFIGCNWKANMQLERERCNVIQVTSVGGAMSPPPPKLGFRSGSLIRIEPLKTKVRLKVIVLLLHHVVDVGELRISRLLPF